MGTLARNRLTKKTVLFSFSNKDAVLKPSCFNKILVTLLKKLRSSHGLLAKISAMTCVYVLSQKPTHILP